MREESFVLVHPVCRHDCAGPGLGDDGRSWFFVSVNRLVRSLGVAAIRVGLTRRIGMMERMVLVAVGSGCAGSMLRMAAYGGQRARKELCCVRCTALSCVEWFEACPVWGACVDGCCACVVCEHEKGIRWMPWHQEAMKDVARCEKPRGAASRL